MTRLTSAQRLPDVGASISQRRMHGAKARKPEGEQESCLGAQGERHLGRQKWCPRGEFAPSVSLSLMKNNPTPLQLCPFFFLKSFSRLCLLVHGRYLACPFLRAKLSVLFFSQLQAFKLGELAWEHA